MVASMSRPSTFTVMVSPVAKLVAIESVLAPPESDVAALGYGLPEPDAVVPDDALQAAQ